MLFSRTLENLPHSFLRLENRLSVWELICILHLLFHLGLRSDFFRNLYLRLYCTLADQGGMEKSHCTFSHETVVPLSPKQGSAPSTVAFTSPYYLILALSIIEATLSHMGGIFFSSTSEFIFNLSDFRWAGTNMDTQLLCF